MTVLECSILLLRAGRVLYGHCWYYKLLFQQITEINGVLFEVASFVNHDASAGMFIFSNVSSLMSS